MRSLIHMLRHGHPLSYSEVFHYCRTCFWQNSVGR